MAIIFADGFESGDTTAWDGTFGASDLEVTAEAALVGSYGLKVKQGTEQPQLEDDFDALFRYRFAFYFDPNGIEVIEGIGEIDPPHIQLFYSDFGTVNVKKVLGNYYVFIEGYDDTFSVASTSADYLISDGFHTIEVDWKAATNAGSNDGFMSLWIDGVFKETLSSLDNYIDEIIFIIIGHCTGYFGDFTGNFYLDGFSSNDDGSQIYGEESASLSPSASLSISPSASLSISSSFSLSESSSVSPSISKSASISPSSSVSLSLSPSSSGSRSVSSSGSDSASISKSASLSPSGSASRSISPSASAAPTTKQGPKVQFMT